MNDVRQYMWERSGVNDGRQYVGEEEWRYVG